jgi:acyl carrier protein
LITGGSALSEDALKFFNGIGYHMANGYGMTEIGITSLEISMKRKMRNKGSVGAPFGCTQYSISDAGELLVRGKTMATRIMQKGVETKTDFDAWFNTRDLAVEENGKYYLQGREDDLIICKNGEKINPELLENSLKVDGVQDLCLFTDGHGRPTLLLSIENCYSPEKLRDLLERALKALEKAQLKDEVQNVALTTDKLLEGNDFKVSRKKIAKRFNDGKFNLIDYQKAEEYTEKMLSVLEQELCVCFSEILQRPIEEISATADFFTDLGGNSLDYFALVDTIKQKFNVELSISENERLSSVQEFYERIKE